MPFTREELAAMAEADAEIDSGFQLTEAEREASDRMDSDIRRRRDETKCAAYRESHRQEIRDRKHEYYIKHRAERLAYQKDYNAKHRVERLAYQKRYNEECEARRLEYQRQHYAGQGG